MNDNSEWTPEQSAETWTQALISPHEIALWLEAWNKRGWLQSHHRYQTIIYLRDKQLPAYRAVWITFLTGDTLQKRKDAWLKMSSLQKSINLVILHLRKSMVTLFGYLRTG